MQRREAPGPASCERQCEPYQPRWEWESMKTRNTYSTTPGGLLLGAGPGRFRLCEPYLLHGAWAAIENVASAVTTIAPSTKCVGRNMSLPLAVGQPPHYRFPATDGNYPRWHL